MSITNAAHNEVVLGTSVATMFDLGADAEASAEPDPVP